MPSNAEYVSGSGWRQDRKGLFGQSKVPLGRFGARKARLLSAVAEFVRQRDERTIAGGGVFAEVARLISP